MKAKDRMNKESVDKISAAIILQSHMDRMAGPDSAPAAERTFIPQTLSSKVSKKRRKR